MSPLALRWMETGAMLLAIGTSWLLTSVNGSAVPPCRLAGMAHRHWRA